MASKAQARPMTDKEKASRDKSWLAQHSLQVEDATCVFIGTKKEAKDYVVALAAKGIQTLFLMRDPGRSKGEREYHVAVPHELREAAGTVLWIASIRPDDISSSCENESGQVHQAG